MIVAPSSTRFGALAVTHAAMVAGQASMVVALADSFFFDVDLDGARTRLLGFLLISFAPFLVVAPLIGRLIDRVRGGRRLMVQATGAGRFVVQVVMIWFTDDVALFPLVFCALVLHKTYEVSKQALVPSVVGSDAELVEANSKLGRIAGVTGAAAVVPAGALQFLFGPVGSLAYGTVFFAAAAVFARGLPRDTAGGGSGPDAADATGGSDDIGVAWAAMCVLRATQGFVLFQIALWFRAEGAPPVWFAAAVGMGSLASFIGNAVAPAVRGRAGLDEERMLAVAVTLAAAVAAGAVLIDGYLAGVVVAAAVNLCAAVGRLAFESIVQRDGSAVNRGHAFARFETRFQFGWVVGATVAVLVPMPGSIGFAYLAAILITAAIGYIRGASPLGRPNSVEPNSSEPQARGVEFAGGGAGVVKREQS